MLQYYLWVEKFLSLVQSLGPSSDICKKWLTLSRTWGKEVPDNMGAPHSKNQMLLIWVREREREKPVELWCKNVHQSAPTRACPIGWRRQGRPRTYWSDYISELAWEIEKCGLNFWTFWHFLEQRLRNLGLRKQWGVNYSIGKHPKKTTGMRRTWETLKC